MSLSDTEAQHFLEVRMVDDPRFFLRVILCTLERASENLKDPEKCTGRSTVLRESTEVMAA